MKVSLEFKGVISYDKFNTIIRLTIVFKVRILEVYLELFGVC